LLFTANCYNLKLGSGCSLGKDLSENERLSQLVKHKDIRMYLQLYCYNQCLLEIAWTRVEGMMTWSAVSHVVSVSASYSRYCYLALFLWFPHVLNPHVCLVDEPWTCINNIDTFLYPYALPILFSLILSQVFA